MSWPSTDAPVWPGPRHSFLTVLPPGTYELEAVGVVAGELRARQVLEDPARLGLETALPGETLALFGSIGARATLALDVGADGRQTIA